MKRGPAAPAPGGAQSGIRRPRRVIQRGEQNLDSTTNIEVTSMLAVSLKWGEAEAYCMLLATCMHVDTT